MSLASSSPQPAANTDSPLLLGVDAGGSKTLATLATSGPDGELHTLGSGRAGSGNPLSGGLEQATNSIRSAVHEALTSAGLHDSTVARVAVVALAGAANEEVRTGVSERLSNAGIAQHCIVESDATPLLATASAHGPCVGLIAGTGSVAVARSAQGAIFRRGGWGYLLGDEGSGYAIGRGALRAVLSGECEEALAQAVCKALDVESSADLIKTVHKSEQPNRTIASLAKVVLALAESGQPAATALAEEAAAALAHLLVEVENRGGLTDDHHPVVFSGGVLLGSTLLQTRLLSLAGISPGRVHLATDPTVGCLRLAQAASITISTDSESTLS